MVAFTGNGYLVANITALLAISASDRPAFRVAVFVAGLGWYEYDNTANTGGLIPADNPSQGRWFQIDKTPPWITVTSNFNALAGRSYVNSTIVGTIIATFPPLSSLVTGNSIRISSIAGMRINTQNVPVRTIFNSFGRVSPEVDAYGAITQWFKIASVSEAGKLVNEFVFTGSDWIQIVGNNTFNSL